jgi:hypothetical protein
MSVNIVHSEVERFVSDDYKQALASEAATAWHGYIGYFGTLSVNADAATVTHHVEGSWFPNIAGADLVRGLRIDGSRLVIETQTASGRNLLTWESAERAGG